MVGVAERLEQHPRTEVGAADAEDHVRIAELPELGRCFRQQVELVAHGVGQVPEAELAMLALVVDVGVDLLVNPVEQRLQRLDVFVTQALLEADVVRHDVREVQLEIDGHRGESFPAGTLRKTPSADMLHHLRHPAAPVLVKDPAVRGRSHPGCCVETIVLDVPLAVFLDRLASAAPTPGGGSVAALCGALSAALGSMVCNLTIGKPRYAEVEAAMAAALAELEYLQSDLADLMAAMGRLRALSAA